jgi:hypothetical protein
LRRFAAIEHSVVAHERKALALGRWGMPRDGRLDPYARTRAFVALDSEIERVAERGGALLLDIGSVVSS